MAAAHIGEERARSWLVPDPDMPPRVRIATEVCRVVEGKCVEGALIPRASFHYRLLPSDAPWLDGIVEIVLEQDGRVAVDETLSAENVPDGQQLLRTNHLSGLPDCARDPGECRFLDEFTARRIAQALGFDEGVEPWRLRVSWFAETQTYTWSVVNTLVKNEQVEAGETLRLDANDGHALQRRTWQAAACQPGSTTCQGAP